MFVTFLLALESYFKVNPIKMYVNLEFLSLDSLV